MIDQIHDEEERDLIDMSTADLRAMPLYRSAPERIGLAIGDELEDWNSEFGDCESGVTWYSEAWGDPPVKVCIGYVRADLYDTIRAQLSEKHDLFKAALLDVANAGKELSEVRRQLATAIESRDCEKRIRKDAEDHRETLTEQLAKAQADRDSWEQQASDRANEAIAAMRRAEAAEKERDEAQARLERAKNQMPWGFGCEDKAFKEKNDAESYSHWRQSGCSPRPKVFPLFRSAPISPAAQVAQSHDGRSVIGSLRSIHPDVDVVLSSAQRHDLLNEIDCLHVARNTAAQVAQGVPDKHHLGPYADVAEAHYARGWNDCRRTMLAAQQQKAGGE